MTQTTAYMEKIKFLNLEEIVKEQKKLTEEKNSRTERIQELAYQNYETFTKTGEALNSLGNELDRLEMNSERLSAHLASLSEQCSQFSRKSTSLERRRRLTSIALAKHPQVMEILEIPNLMEKCVRQGSYEEALQLAADVKRMDMKIGNIPVIQSIHRDVEEQRLAMLSILISQLRGQIQRPQCVRIIGYLRRLGIYSEAELRLKYLQSRNAWLQSTLDSIQADNSYQLMLNIIETTRQNMFEIVTQYRALFSEDDPLLLIEGENRSFINETAILPQWLSFRVRLFIKKLKETIPLIPANMLDTIVDKCMYFGMSFGRVGADFRGQLVPVFLSAFFSKFSETVLKGKTTFRENLDSWSIEEAVMRVTNGSSLGQASESSSPSYSLLAYAPLAELCNAFVLAFNDLRISPPLAIYNDVTNLCAETLEHCAEELANFYQRRIAGGNRATGDFFQLICVRFRDSVVGFVENALGLLFPIQEVSRYSGLSMVQLQNERASRLDRAKITSKLAEFIPQPVEEEIEEEPAPNQQEDEAEVTPRSNELPQTEQETLQNSETSVVADGPSAVDTVVEAVDLNVECDSENLGKLEGETGN